MFDRTFESEAEAAEWIGDCQDPTEAGQRSRYVQQNKESGLIPNTWEHQQRTRAEEDETPKKAEKEPRGVQQPSNGGQNLRNVPTSIQKRGEGDGRTTHKVPNDLNERWKKAARFECGGTHNKNKLLSRLLDCLDKDPLFISKILDN